MDLLEQLPRRGESQVDATRRILRESGLNRAALDAIFEANAKIDKQAKAGSTPSSRR